jgi:hypothetical protein
MSDYESEYWTGGSSGSHEAPEAIMEISSGLGSDGNTYATWQSGDTVKQGATYFTWNAILLAAGQTMLQSKRAADFVGLLAARHSKYYEQVYLRPRGILRERERERERERDSALYNPLATLDAGAEPS